jgi:SAM-dependent methyltransferase
MASSMLASPLSDGRTSYEFLAERVAGARRVLDLGCADGTLLAVLARNGARELAGIDLSDGELALARRRPELVRADLRLGHAQELPFPDDSFDAAVSHMALMLMSDIEQVVAETARVVRPGGVFAVAVGAGAVPGGGFDLFLSLARPVFTALPDDRRVPLMGDRRTRSREGLDEVLAPAGFAPTSWDEITLQLVGTPEQIWNSAVASYYDAAMLNHEEAEGLHEKFIAEATAMCSGGSLTAGVRISVATTRLRAA